MDKFIKYVPYAMALIIGLIANRIIAILGFFTDNELLSNGVGLLIGIAMLALWKLIYYKLVTKKENDRLDQFK